MAADKPNNFGDWLRCERETRGLALREVAERTGLDFTLLSRFETGNRIPTEEQADALAKFFRRNRQEAHALRIAAQFKRQYSAHPAARAAIEHLAEEQRPAFKRSQPRRQPPRGEK